MSDQIAGPLPAGGERLHAAVAIGKRRLFEGLIHPGFYIALTLSLAIAYAFVSAFIRSIDSSGFNYTMTPLYTFAGGLLAGAFGQAVLAKLFADGPFLFAVNVAFLPMLLYLSMTSVYRFGTEKISGAIELLAYGPADGTSYFFASMLKDLVLTLLTLVAFLVFFLAAGAVENIAVTARLFDALLLLLLSSLAIYAWGVLVSAVTDSANSALAIFLAGFVVLVVSLVGSYAIVSGYVQSLSAVAAWVIQWFSPFYYWSIGTRATIAGEGGLYVLGAVGLLVLTAALLVGSHFIIRQRGVRP